MSDIVNKNNIEEQYSAYLTRIKERCQLAFLPFLNGDVTKFQKLAASYSFALKENPELLKCDPDSIIKGFKKCCELSLDPSPNLGKIYLIPRKNNDKGTYEVVAQTGYQGLLEIAMRRTDIISNIYAQIVYEGDEFEIVYGKDIDYRYIPKFKSTQLKLTFAVIKFKDGNICIEYASKEEIDESRRRSKTDKVWRAYYNSMAKIVPLRKILKLALCLNIDDDTFIKDEERIKTVEANPIMTKDSDNLSPPIMSTDEIMKLTRAES